MKFPIVIFEADYKPDYVEDEELIWKIKDAIQRLRPVEKKILLTYVEGGTYTSVAKTFNVSVPTARTYINEVINKVKNDIGFTTD